MSNERTFVTCDKKDADYYMDDCGDLLPLKETSTPNPSPQKEGSEVVIPTPTGAFILEQKDIKYMEFPDGYYYHYADVVSLINRFVSNSEPNPQRSVATEDQSGNESLETKEVDYKKLIADANKPEDVKMRNDLAVILKENIYFSGQADGYLVHGAIDKIVEYFKPTPIEKVVWLKEELQKVQEGFDLSQNVISIQEEEIKELKKQLYNQRLNTKKPISEQSAERSVATEVKSGDESLETNNDAMKNFIDRLNEKQVKVTFGLTENNLEVINKHISKFRNAKFNSTIWEDIGKEISWHPLTAALYYFNKCEYEPSHPQEHEKEETKKKTLVPESIPEFNESINSMSQEARDKVDKSIANNSQEKEDVYWKTQFGLLIKNCKSGRDYLNDLTDEYHEGQKSIYDVIIEDAEETLKSRLEKLPPEKEDSGYWQRRCEAAENALDKITSFHPDSNPISMINYAKATLKEIAQLKSQHP